MTAPTPTPAPSPDALKASYGFVGSLANSVPELKTILDQAVREQWTSDRFTMAVAGSNWYRTNQNYARELITKQAVDPATAAADRKRTWVETSLVAESMGIRLTPDQLSAVTFMKQTNPSMSEEYLRAHIARNYFDPSQDWSKLTGTAGQLANQVQQIAEQYGWGDANQKSGEARDWLMKLMDGTESVDAFSHRMVEYAKVKYPGLSSQLASGLTVKQLAQPYTQAMSKVLELPESSINWTDDKLISKAMQYRPETGGKSGEGKDVVGTMPIYQFEDTLRKDPRWNKTDNAKDSTAQMLTKIGKDFGMIG